MKPKNQIAFLVPKSDHYSVDFLKLVFKSPIHILTDFEEALNLIGKVSRFAIWENTSWTGKYIDGYNAYKILTGRGQDVFLLNTMLYANVPPEKQVLLPVPWKELVSRLIEQT